MERTLRKRIDNREREREREREKRVKCRFKGSQQLTSSNNPFFPFFLLVNVTNRGEGFEKRIFDRRSKGCNNESTISPLDDCLS